MKFAGLLQTIAAAAVLTISASADEASALAPWFDADGFYNKSGVDLPQATSDFTACRIEALRLKTARNTRTQVGSGMAFRADGTYDPVVSGAATGIASILFAIQDSRYNGSIEHVEFRDCMRSLGYGHYQLNARRRAEINATDDSGFAMLVGATTPAEGRADSAPARDNYYAADLAPSAYQNAALSEPTLPADAAPAAPPAAAVIERIAMNEAASPRDGAAIIVLSVRDKTSALTNYGGEELRFTRVTADGRFVELLQPTSSFAVLAYHPSERRRDPSLDGNAANPRYSTYQIPAGRYVLSYVGRLNACLGTLTFEVHGGDVAYLGDYVFRPPNIPLTPLFNPLANINTGMDNALKNDLRVGIGDDLEAARAALQADDASKARLARVAYQSGYRIPCDGSYIGRVANTAWPAFDPAQARSFQDAMGAAAAAAH